MGVPPAPGARARIRCSMSTKRPESGSELQLVLAEVWTRISRPLPRWAMVIERRAVLQGGEGGSRQSGAGLGQHLAADAHLLGREEAGEGAVGIEGCEAERLLPGERTAQHPVAGTERDRDQVVAAGGKPRAGEAEQHPALLHPGIEPSPLGGVDPAGVGQDHERQRAVGELGDPALAQLGRGAQGPGDEVELGEEGLVVLGPAGADHADRAPAPALVEQHRAANSLRRRQLQPGDAVAHVGRQLELRRTLAARRRRRRSAPGPGSRRRARAPRPRAWRRGRRRPARR